MKSSAILLLLLGELCSSGSDAGQAPGGGTRSDRQVEEIYVGRNILESRTPPTEFCAQIRTGFGAAAEDRYTLRSIATRAVDGRMIGANVNVIGRFRTCVGTTPDPLALKVYAEGALGSISLTVLGDCRALKQDYPETGITPYGCAFDVRDLPPEYIGGQVTTNTVSSRAIGDKSDPPGYTQPSVVTIRLWRRRQQ